jgi:RNA polymerase sigma-70 factor (sigma-E family)
MSSGHSLRQAVASSKHRRYDAIAGAAEPRRPRPPSDGCNELGHGRCNQDVAPSLSRFPAGDAAFEAFVRAAGPGLLRFGHVLTVDRSAAEDLAQETFIRVGLAWSRVRADGNPVAYAQRTMVNLFLNQRRRRTDVPTAALPERTGDDQALAAVDAASNIRHLLAGLPPKQRAALALRYVADLPDDQIAELIGCSPPTVRSQISRGLATLRLQSVQER